MYGTMRGKPKSDLDGDIDMRKPKVNKPGRKPGQLNNVNGFVYFKTELIHARIKRNERYKSHQFQS